MLGSGGRRAQNELVFGFGGLPPLSRSDAPSVNAGPGTGLQVTYGRRFLDGNKFAFYSEINFLASPLREVSSSVTSATQNFASLYVTPGLRLKAFPKSRISPYLAAGGDMRTMSEVRPRLTATRARHHGSLFA
jgi:hypothetical protein